MQRQRGEQQRQLTGTPVASVTASCDKLGSGASRNVTVTAAGGTSRRAPAGGLEEISALVRRRRHSGRHDESGDPDGDHDRADHQGCDTYGRGTLSYLPARRQTFAAG